MSVYIRKGAKDGVYSYDFQLQNRRFLGSTGCSTEREARKVERIKRQEAQAELEAEKAFSDPNMTIAVATSRYWLEKGQHHENWENTEWSMAWLVNHFGSATLLADIGDERIAAAVAKRRGEFVPSQRKKDRKYKTPEIRRRVSAATVNRTVTQPLREVILRATRIWKARVAQVDWSAHLLAEPKERVREASVREEQNLIQQLDRGYDDAVRFALMTGCRRMEIIGLEWSRVDFFGRQIRVIGKGRKERSIPMAQAIFDLLWALRGNHPTAVFTYEAKKTVNMRDGRRLCRGVRYPLTEAGLKTAFRRAVPKSGLVDFRFHDTRHTTATRVLRKSNLRVVQNLLGHSDIKTTTKYAHAVMGDILAALEATSPAESPAEPTRNGNNPLKTKKKIG